MKKTLLIAGLLVAFTASAQNTNRYYPSLKNLLSDSMNKQMPADFNYYDTWIRNVVQAVFYKDLQHTVSTRNDASFDAMGLIFKRQNTFKVGNSGFELIVNKDKPDFSTPVNIQMEQKFRILAYQPNFDPNSYDPKDYKKKYDLGLLILNLSEEQVIAEFINRYISESKEKKTAIQRLADDLKKEAKVKIAVDEKNDSSLLKTIAIQIYQQTNKYASDVLYDIYLKTNDPKKEAQNFAGFFRKYHPGDPSGYIDEVVGYEATIAIPKTEVSVIIPKEVLEVFTINPKTNATILAESTLEVKPRQIEMKTIITAKKKCVQFTLTLPKNNSDASFKVLKEIALNKHAFLKPNQRTLTTLKVADIKKLIFSITDKEIEVEMIARYENNDWNFIIMKQPCSLN
ncbi:hypothetical protein [Flavobacterium sangjuense]|uniref:Uncharacterized protein n=1 Tax=Flavobacterium sangjuense TaxID=2518177 RepID=A0A4P7PVZ7_9FLAO|nr:hypothetical protein [Flavobacterium sangjuense]QBZ98570.1 hypothetical protein GS03_02079 [Flavobacterium sangjuense]